LSTTQTEMLGTYISVSRYHLMSRIYLPPERSRRNENSSATAAFQARRLIPFLAWQKTKGHLKGYERKKVWQDHTRRKTICASSDP